MQGFRAANFHRVTISSQSEEQAFIDAYELEKKRYQFLLMWYPDSWILVIQAFWLSKYPDTKRVEVSNYPKELRYPIFLQF